MKIPQKNKSKKRENNNKIVKKPKKDHVLVVAQEIKFARLLSSNEKNIRDRALKSLKKWLLNCFDKGYEFKENDFLRLWKGLFYAVWMSDKPLVQEELCEKISSILDVFPVENYKDALLLVKVGFQMLATEWYGIDHHRMDKFLMLVRRYLRGSLRCVARSKWSDKACQQYNKMLTDSDGILALKTPVYARNATSMILHIIDCYLEEIAKVSKSKISAKTVANLVAPFCEYMCLGENEVIATSCRRLLTGLLRQSTPGLQYQDKTRAWEQMGCPEGGPDALELASDQESGSDDEGNDDVVEDESANRMDPRAGRANVTLTPLPVGATQIAALLNQCRLRAKPSAVRRATITIKRFEALAKDEYPLKVQPMELDDGRTLPKPKEAAKSLQALEKTLIASSDELALRGLSRKHRKRLLAKSRAGFSIVEDAALATTDISATGDWQIEEAKPAKKIKKQNGDNKENLKRKLKKRKLDEKRDPINKKIKTDHTVKSVDGKEKVKHKNVEKTNKSPDIPKLKKKHVEKFNKNPEIPKSILKNVSPKSEKKLITNKESVTKKVKNTDKMQNGVTRKTKIQNGDAKNINKTKILPTVVAKKVKKFPKQLSLKGDKKSSLNMQKKVKFVLKNNSKQDTIDYYKSVRQNPKIPFDSSVLPSKTNLKPSTPSPINPFFKKKWKLSA